ncbi:MAG: PxKF domain-containing protein [Angustibacter sp.]
MGAARGAPTATVGIRDDEPLVVTVTAPHVDEGDSGTTSAPFTVSVTAPPAGTTVTGDWALAAGTAQIPDDVLAASGHLTLTSDVTSTTVEAQVVGDTAAEQPTSETFRLDLTGLTASDGRQVLVADTSVGVVTDDDQAAPPPQTWPFEGFFAPVDNPPVVNVVKAGSTVQLKFGLGGDRGLAIFAAGYPASQRVGCDGSATSDVLEETASPGASALTYDATTQRYQLNWKTQKAWAGTCRTLVLRMADGSEHTAQLRFH